MKRPSTHLVLTALLGLSLVACAVPGPQTIAADACATIASIRRPAANGWATVAVRLRVPQPLQVKAAAKTPADIAYYDVKLVNVLTGVVTAAGQVTNQDVVFTSVPDGTYQLVVDAVDGAGQSLIQGGEQWSVNQVTVASPTVTYSGGLTSLMVNLALLPASGETVATTVNVKAGNAYYGPAQVGCRPPTDGTWMGYATTIGDLYTIGGTGTAGFSGDGGPARAATLDLPQGLAVDAAGNPIVADSGNGRVRMLSGLNCAAYGQTMAANAIYTVAGGGLDQGDDLPPREASFGSPRAVALDPDGNLYVADAARDAIYLATRKAGTYFDMDIAADRLWQVVGGGSGDDGVPVYQAQLKTPSGLVVDAQGNLVIADTGHHRIRFVPRSDGTFFGQTMTANQIYTIAGSGATGAPADQADARTATLNAPEGVALDRLGNVYVADTGNHVVRLLPRLTGTYFGRLRAANGIYTVAGNGVAGFADSGTATGGSLNQPKGVAVDGDGNLLIADTTNNRLRFVPVADGNYFLQTMPANGLYTVAGNGMAGHGGDSGPALSATLDGPQGVAVDPNGNAYVTCTATHRVLMVMRGLAPVPALK